MKGTYNDLRKLCAPGPLAGLTTFGSSLVIQPLDYKLLFASCVCLLKGLVYNPKRTNYLLDNLEA